MLRILAIVPGRFDMNEEPTLEEKVRAAFVVQWEDAIAIDDAKPRPDAVEKRV